MTTFKAVLTRVGILPAAAGLVLIGSLAARAEDANVGDKAAAAAPQAAATKKEDAIPSAKKAATKSDASAQAVPSAGAGKDDKAAGAATKDAQATDANAKDAGAKAVTKAEAPKAEAPKAEVKDASSGAASTKNAAAADSKDAAPAEKKPEDAAAAKTDAGKPTDAAKADAASAKTDNTAAAKEGGADKAEAAKSEAGDKPAAERKAETPAQAAPATTAALPDAATAAPSAGVSDSALPPADAIVADVRQMIPDATKGANADDVAALAAYYEELNGPAIWVSHDGLTPKGKAVVAEIGKADDWGLRASDFDVPHLAEGKLDTDAAARAEIKVGVAVLKYARYARGGRINPARISPLMDQSPHLKAPKLVLTEVAVADAPDAYLRSLQPQQEQFKRLRQVLLKLRGSNGKVEDEPEEEDATVSVNIPPGRLIRPGMEDPQVALLRQRLSVPTDDPAYKNVYDPKLQDAVRAFQRSKGLRPDALVGNNTRALLNGQPKPVVASSGSQIERILVNMERWRWEPEHMGDFYVWDNVPEFLTRVVKDGKIIHTDKIVVGQPTWPTPIFSANMKYIVFHPSWGVPSGIKSKELAPLLRKSSGGAGLFGIFGGGYSAQAVLDAYQLKVYYNGRQIDPNQVDWSSANIAAYSFQQPPGPKNVLGDVKFMFPNSHDVYMHDTPERNLFARSFRALSHGCMRVEEPRKLAEVLLGEDKGWSPQKVQSMFNGYSQTVNLDKQIPVHITYFTARVDDNGKLHTYADFYGLDSRTAAALTGRSVHFEQPAYDDGPVASDDPAPGTSSTYSRRAHKKPSHTPTLADAISNIFSP